MTKGVRGYLIRGGRVIDPSRNLDVVTDVLIEGDVIRAVGDKVSALVTTSGFETINAEGLVVAPGFVDLHVHFREPGTEGETIASGGKAAVAGGFTTVCVMPNTNPAIDDAEQVDWQHSRANDEIARDGAMPRLRVVGALTASREGKRCSDVAGMARAGVVALSDDGSGVQDAGVMLAAMERAAEHGLPVSDHAEDACLAGNGIIGSGEVSEEWGVQGKPSVAEEAMIARDIEIARATGAHLHVAHLSTKRGVELVRRAKNDGLRVTAEVTPHHLALTDRALVSRESIYDSNGIERRPSDLDPNKKMNPPLRGRVDVDALIDGLREGVIDAVATDHAPHPAAKKAKGIELAPNGVIGLETAFSVIHGLTGRCGYPMDLSRVVELLSTGPAKVFGLDAGTLKPGRQADLVILAPSEAWTVKPDEIVSTSRNSPWLGKDMRGRVRHTFVGGRLVYSSKGGSK